MRDKTIRHYNIHDILTFQVIYDDGRNYLPDFNNPFSYFEVDFVADPSIILNIGSFEPNNSHCDIVFKKYHVKENYIYCREHEGFTKWQVEFIGIEDAKTIVNFAWERKALKAFVAPNNFSQVVYLESLLDFKLTKMGYCLLHTAAIDDNKTGVHLFSGRSGSSKTSIIAYSINELGYSYLGDDKIIVKDGAAYSFLRYLRLFEHLLISDYSKEHGTLTEKLKAAAFIMKSSPRSARRFNVIKQGKITSANLVCKAQDLTSERIFEQYNSAIYSLTNNNLAESMSDLNNTSDLNKSSYFFNMMCAYAYIFPKDNNFLDFQNVTKLLNNSIPKDVEVTKIVNPKANLRHCFVETEKCHHHLKSNLALEKEKDTEQGVE